MEGFAARYPGTCVGCGNRFDISALVAYNEDDQLYGVECCGYLSMDEPGDIDAKAGREKIRVMPTGKSKRDACPRCFIIHTAGQGDECE